MANKQELTTSNAKMFWDERGFVHVIFLNNNTIFDKEEAKLHYEFACKLSEDKPYKALIDATNSLVLSSEEAQKYSLENTPLKKAEAIVVTTLPMRISSKFYVKRFSSTKAAIFKNQEEAISWLSKQPL